MSLCNRSCIQNVAKNGAHVLRDRLPHLAWLLQSEALYAGPPGLLDAGQRTGAHGHSKCAPRAARAAAPAVPAVLRQLRRAVGSGAARADHRRRGAGGAGAGLGAPAGRQRGRGPAGRVGGCLGRRAGAGALRGGAACLGGANPGAGASFRVCMRRRLPTPATRPPTKRLDKTRRHVLLVAHSQFLCCLLPAVRLTAQGAPRRSLRRACGRYTARRWPSTAAATASG